MDKKQTWLEAQQWEKEWHDDCINSYNEETKQFTYASLMGLNAFLQNYYGQRFWDMGSKSILDVGCGPYSMLLKVKTSGAKYGVDPIRYPDWVLHRYHAAKIQFIEYPAECLDFPINYEIYGQELPAFVDFTKNPVDEAWIYNCLQHVQDPEKIISNVKKCAKVIRIFEWIDQGISPGHLHDLKEHKLNDWLGGKGQVYNIAERGCYGSCYHGIFKGEHYGK